MISQLVIISLCMINLCVNSPFEMRVAPSMLDPSKCTNCGAAGADDVLTTISLTNQGYLPSKNGGCGSGKCKRRGKCCSLVWGGRNRGYFCPKYC